MNLIDEEGNVFGIINAIDLLFLLVLFGVSVAGVALFLADGGQQNSPSELATTNVTIDLGSQPAYLVDHIDAVDSTGPTGTASITVTDVHLVPNGSAPKVLVRAQVTGQKMATGIEYDDEPVRLGRRLSIRTETYQVKGKVTKLDTSQTFSRTKRSVLVRSLGPTSTAHTLAEGTALRAGGRPIGHVDDVIVYEATGQPSRIVYLNLTIQTIREQHGHRLDAGSPVTVRTDGGGLEGTVESTDDQFTLGTTQVLMRETVPSSIVDAISAGDRYRLGGHQVAVVESVRGYGTTDPDEKQVFVGLTLTTLEDSGRLTFGNDTIRSGTVIPFRTPKYALSGEITRIGAASQRGRATHDSIRLTLADVSPSVAESITVGATETVAGRQVARITSIERSNASVTVTDEDGNVYSRGHPVRRDLTVTANLSVQDTAWGTTFKGRTIQRDAQITLDLGGVTIRPTVVALDAS